MNNDYKLTIGLEVHAVITASKCKLFSIAPNNNIEDANTQVQYLDMGFPGALQVLNDEPVGHTVRTCVALNMKINELFSFDRKHYTYPDLPCGYQITQFYRPIGIDGHLSIFIGKHKKKIRINRLHMETDAGKSTHTSTKTILDYNRSGGPLMEIVTEPDLKTADEAVCYVKMLRATLRHINVCDGNMELGNFRVDVNISISKNDILGTRVEIKNLNSTRAIKKAIEYEFDRQKAVLLADGKVMQETRLFNEKSNSTVFMRNKEDPQEYMYFPDPDLPTYIIAENMVHNQRNSIRMLPERLFEDWHNKFMLSYDILLNIIEQPEIVYYLDKAFDGASLEVQKQIIKLMVGEVFARLKDEQHIDIAYQDLRDFAKMIIKNNLNSLLIKEIFNEMWDSGETIEEVIKRKNITLVSKDEIMGYVISVCNENPEEYLRYKDGELKLFGFFVGKVMTKLENKANPKEIRDTLEAHFNENK